MNKAGLIMMKDDYVLYKLNVFWTVGGKLCI